jgi:ribonuclease D
VTLAAKRPATREALDALALPGVQSGRVASLVKTWLGAIAEGVRDADLPEAERTFFTPPPPDRDALARRRARETAVNAWRRAEAKRRQIDEQAVLPGHCAEAVVSALVAHESDPAALRDAIARIPGFGARRCERYLDALAALAAPGPPARG